MLKYILIAITALTATAGNSETLSKVKLESGQEIIHFEGKYTKGTAKRLYDYANETGLKTVSFNSGGGIATEGDGAAWVMEKLGLVGMVKKENTCMSACAITMLGAPVVDIKGLVGFHPAYLPTPMKDADLAFQTGQKLSMKDTIFLKDKGVSNQVIKAIGYFGKPDIFFVLTSTADWRRIFDRTEKPYEQTELLGKMWHSNVIGAYIALTTRGIKL